MRKLISTFLFSVAYAGAGEFQVDDGQGGLTNYCLVCEYINVADTEADAEAALQGTSNACVTAQVNNLLFLYKL